MTTTEQQNKILKMQEEILAKQEEILANNALMLDLLQKLSPEDQKIYAPKVEALIKNTLNSKLWHGTSSIPKT